MDTEHEQVMCACGSLMPAGRLEIPRLEGKCSECVVYPRREALRIERERRVAAFGEGRC
jgi:hypothetical protein